MPKGSTVPAVQMRTLPTATHVLAFSIHAAVSTLLPATTQHSCLTQSYFFQYITPTSSVSPLLSWHTTFFFLPPPCRMKKFQLLKAHISLLTVSLFTDSHRYTQTNSAWESTAQPGALQPEHQTELSHHSNKWVFNVSIGLDISLAWSSMSRTLSNLPVPKSFLREQKVHGFFNKVCLHNKTCNPITFPPILLSWKLRPFLLEKNHWLMKFDNILSHWKLRSFSRKCWAILEDLYNNTWGRFEEQGWASTSGASL